MEYMILDTAGNAVASSDDETTARATLHAIVAVEPEAAEYLVLLAYDDDGQPLGDAKTFFDVPPAVEVVASDCASQFVMQPLTDRLIRNVLREKSTIYVANSPPSWSPQGVPTA